MTNFKDRKQIQWILIFALFLVVSFSKNAIFIITCYLAITHTFLNTFWYLREKEIEREEGGSKRNFWAQTITFLSFQILILAGVFGVTWFVFEKKKEVLKAFFF